MYRSKIQEAVKEAVDRINGFLAPSDLRVEVDEPDIPRENCIGEYEAGSVFEKTIVIRVFYENLTDVASEEGLSLDAILREARITVYHETGHGLMEQLLDWADSFPEETAGLAEKYFDIFDDANLTEEEIVETFARRFDAGASSLLKSCFVEANEILKNT